MLLHVVRDECVAPGGETWFVTATDLLFVVSAEGVSPAGAVALEWAWQGFVDAGEWVFGGEIGAPARPRYFLTDRFPRVPALVTTRGDWVKMYLNPDHFAVESAAGLTVVAGEGAARGWRVVSPVAARVAA